MKYLTVGELRKLLITSIEQCDIPDDAPVVVPGSDHNFRLLGEPQIEDADGDPKSGLGEPDPSDPNTRKVLVFR